MEEEIIKEEVIEEPKPKPEPKPENKSLKEIDEIINLLDSAIKSKNLGSVHTAKDKLMKLKDLVK